jgi:hypothetical protein
VFSPLYFLTKKFLWDRGWASVGQRGKARQYAMQQKNVAIMLQDETLELLSNVYIAYAHLFEGERQIAQKMIDVTIVLFIYL